MPAIDYDLLETDVQERIRDHVVGFDDVKDADDLADALSKGRSGSEAFTFISEERSDRPTTVGGVAQVERVTVTVVVVTGSFRSKDAAQKSNQALRRAVKIALCGDKTWKPAGAMRSLDFQSARFFARTRSRVAYEMRFGTTAYNDYQE